MVFEEITPDIELLPLGLSGTQTSSNRAANFLITI
jgi:hypothetical protein